MTSAERIARWTDKHRGGGGGPCPNCAALQAELSALKAKPEPEQPPPAWEAERAELRQKVVDLEAALQAREAELAAQAEWLGALQGTPTEAAARLAAVEAKNAVGRITKVLKSAGKDWHDVALPFDLEAAQPKRR